MESDVARRVVEALQVQLGVDEEASLREEANRESGGASSLFVRPLSFRQVYACRLDERDPLL